MPEIRVRYIARRVVFDTRRAAHCRRAARAFVAASESADKTTTKQTLGAHGLQAGEMGRRTPA